MAQGYTPREAGKIMGTLATPSLSTRLRNKLGASTTAHAVFLACQWNLIGPREECGRLSGLHKHRDSREDLCNACRVFYADYTERTNTPLLRQEPLSRAEVQLLRAYDAGRTFNQILENWGCSRRTLDDVRTNLYRKLDVGHLPQSIKYHAALDEGRMRGYLRPVRPERPPNLNPRRWGTTDLTELEQRTLSALTGGNSLAQAGLILGIPGSAVSARLARIYKKLGVLDQPHGHRREAAFAEAKQRGYGL
jgi:DNA-binding CsgD family transcriptional regulator